MTPVLRVESLTVNYGGVRALDGVDLTLMAGETMGIIGANGAGKTTFVDALTGFTAGHGSVFLGGQDLGRMAPHRRAQSGLCRTFQSCELFDDLTVSENIHIAAVLPSLRTIVPAILRGRQVVDHETAAVLQQLGIPDLAPLKPAQLSTGQRKLVAIARALVSRPRVLCLDEPAAGLDPTETGECAEMLRSIASSGVAILLVDHDMDLVLSVCDRVLVLDFGRVIACGTAHEVRTDPVVQAAYLGTLATDTDPLSPSAHGCAAGSDVPDRGAARRPAIPLRTFR